MNREGPVNDHRGDVDTDGASATQCTLGRKKDVTLRTVFPPRRAR